MRDWVAFILVLATCIGLAPGRRADAHVGPPFPILVDQPIPGYLVTVWADPDVGQAVFYVVLEPSSATASSATADVPAVKLWVQPVNQRRPKAIYEAKQEATRGSLRYVARPEFDAPEMWTVGIDIYSPRGATQHLVTEVEATPPGLGPWDVLIYLFPFLLFGGLWGYAFLRRSREAAARRGHRHTDVGALTAKLSGAS